MAGYPMAMAMNEPESIYTRISWQRHHMQDDDLVALVAARLSKLNVDESLCSQLSKSLEDLKHLAVQHFTFLYLVSDSMRLYYSCRSGSNSMA